MAAVAVLGPPAPAPLDSLLPQTPSSYLKLPFALPEKRIVGLLAAQRDPLLRRIQTRVVRCDKCRVATIGGQKKSAKQPLAEEWEVELLDTVCFPTGGGQPSDTATITSLSSKIVTRVRECVRVGLTAVHICDQSLQVGDSVEVEIDWPRRLDLMTQHLGQHLISAVLEREFQLDTPSWALTPFPEPSYIEVPRTLTAEELSRVEQLCNEYIRADLPVTVDVSLPSEDNPRPAKLPADYIGGVHRVVSIAGIDSNPCCGSHPPKLGLLQSVKIFSHTTAIRGTNARIYFVVGGRVPASLDIADRQLRDSCVELSCGPLELASRISQIVEDRKTLAKRESRLRTRLAQFDADVLMATGERIMLKNDADDDAEYLSLVAWALLDKGLSHAVALACQPQAGASDGSLVVCGGDKMDVIAVSLRKTFGSRLRGGGKGRFQGRLTGRWATEDIEVIRQTLSAVA